MTKANTKKTNKKGENTMTLTQEQLTAIIAEAVAMAIANQPKAEPTTTKKGRKSQPKADDTTTYSGKWGHYKVVEGTGKGSGKHFVEITFTTKTVSAEKREKLRAKKFSGFKHKDGTYTYSRYDDESGKARELAKAFCG